MKIKKKNKKLLIARINANLEIKELAQKASISSKSYYSYENGNYKPNIDVAFVIADILGTTVEQIFKD